MTDADLLAKKLAEIETYVQELRTLADLEKVRHDVKEERFAAHTLQLAIQNTLDVCSHVISDDRLGEPQTNQDLFTLLERHRWIGARLAANLRNMAGFRNIMVHAYDKLNLDVMVDVLRNHLVDFDDFVDAIRTEMKSRAGAD